MLCIESNIVSILDYNGNKILSRSWEVPFKEVFNVKYSNDGNLFSLEYDDMNDSSFFEIINIHDLQTKFFTEYIYPFITFYDTGDTLCYIFQLEKNVVHYLNKNYKIINEWKLPQLYNIATISLNKYSSCYSSSRFVSGYYKNDFYLFNLKTKDTIILNNVIDTNINYYENENVLFQYDYPDMIFERNAKNKVFKIFDLKMNNLGTYKYNGKGFEGFEINDVNLFINSTNLGFGFSKFGKLNLFRSLPPTYIQAFDMKSGSELYSYTLNHYFEEVSDDFKYALLTSWDSNWKYLLFDTEFGKELIEFNNNELSNLSNDGKYLLFYDREINKVRLFPLDPEEIIKRVRTDKEFGDIRYLNDKEKKEYGIVD
jgi:uncharacterized protein YkuJ